MRVVFEMKDDEAGTIYVVDVLEVDEINLTGIHKGAKRTFSIASIQNATTVSGRPFSLRPYSAPASQSLPYAV